MFLRMFIKNPKTSKEITIFKTGPISGLINQNSPNNRNNRIKTNPISAIIPATTGAKAPKAGVKMFTKTL